MCKFRLPIGDWSGDGHDKCEYFIVEANRSLEEVIEVYKEVDSIIGISKELVEYEQDKFSEEFLNSEFVKDIDIVDYIDGDINDYSISPIQLAHLILDAMMFHAPYLELKIIDDEIPLFNRFSKNYFFELPGYGLFE